MEQRNMAGWRGCGWNVLSERTTWEGDHIWSLNELIGGN